ncbi:MAG: GNAT family N-acetyltransferase [Candidatus Latescibacterota bacterium]
MKCRPYDKEKDRSAAHRIWREIGWIEQDKEAVVDLFSECGSSLVAEVGGETECLVTAAPGTIRYLDEELPFSCITGVTTSRVARKKGLARRLTALSVAGAKAEGALVSGLGMFEQGYYNQLGFGSGGYEHRASFDPSRLKVRVKARVPRRIGFDDWDMAHASRLARARGHGGCNLTPPELTQAQMCRAKNGFGLGYCDGPNGELTHHFWCTDGGMESGPYTIGWMTFRTPDQFLELIALIKSLGDQVRLVTMREPQGIQLQDLLDRPLKGQQVSEKSRFENRIHALAYWQMRINDLPGCMARTHLPGDVVRFNLELSDPIGAHLDGKAPWRGITGRYVVSLGPASNAEPGTDPTLSLLSASVGAFTRLWLGVRPAGGLAVTDELSGPRELLGQLDELMRLPDPKPDWDF